MRRRWTRTCLGDLFEIARGGSPRPIDSFLTDDPAGVPWIMIGDASAGVKYISSTRRRIVLEGVCRSRMVKPGDFLLTNSMSFGRPYIVRLAGCIHDGWLVLSPKNAEVDTNFFYHLLGSRALYAEFKRRAAGATVKNLNTELVRGVEVMVPPLEDQRRIAEVLDRAESLRNTRQQALEGLDELQSSIFVELFGDITESATVWPRARLRDVLARPLRNGLSPSTSGAVHAKVLTLSAITGREFDSSAWKIGTFQAPPPPDQAVHSDDLLICRGNGSVKLVGKGYFPPDSLPDVTFPDTVIAARIDTARIEPAFLEHLWNGESVRRALEAAARTTNGTYKVNQAMLENIPLVVPPLPLQREFSARVNRLRQLRHSQRCASEGLDSLFASLQHRAFRGEL